jgi:GT2 family glycosyltransferase
VQVTSIEEKEQRIAGLQRELAALRRSIEEKDRRIVGLNFQLLTMQRTIEWKVLERLRQVRDSILPPQTRRRKVYWGLRRIVEVLLDEGLYSCVRKSVYKIYWALRGQVILVRVPPQEDSERDLNAQYEAWLHRYALTAEAKLGMKARVETFTYTPIISLLTPISNRQETWLRKAIESVRGQIYPHWELCLIHDGSTTPQVKPILDQYASLDPRIKVQSLSGNEAIAGAPAHILGQATGEFVGFLDDDDELSPDTLFEVVKRLNEDPALDLLYSDEDRLELDGRRVEPFLKPDWSPDLLLSMNYLAHFNVFRRSVLQEITGFRRDFDGRQNYDLILRLSERTTKIAHIPKILYHGRKVPDSSTESIAEKPDADQAAQRALEDALKRRGVEGAVRVLSPGRYRVCYKLRGTPLVSIIIPTRDKKHLLEQCVCSVEERTDYPRYEIIILDNDSSDPETLEYLQRITRKWPVLRYPRPFNFSAINNFGASQARGDYFLFLNNDTQVIQSEWLTAMMEHGQRPEVGAVGAKLLYPNGQVQHAGVVIGISGVAGHVFRHYPGDDAGDYNLIGAVRNCSAVTAACMLVPRRVFEEVGGFDERLVVALNDIDLCLRLRRQGYLIVYTPFALLYHHEYASRGRLHPPEDERLYRKRWHDLITAGDPYYNPNLTLTREDWSLRF